MSEISKRDYHIGANPQLYEPARSNTFEFLMNDELNTMLMACVDPETATEDDYLTNCQEKIRLSVENASVPQFSLEAINIRRGNASFKFVGQPTFDSGSLKIVDYVGARTVDIMLAWQARAYDVINDVVQLATNYKYDCELDEYNPDMTKIVRRWRLIGCWVSKVSVPELSHSENQKREMDITIEYDRAIPIVDKVFRG